MSDFFSNLLEYRIQILELVDGFQRVFLKSLICNLSKI